MRGMEIGIPNEKVNQAIDLGGRMSETSKIRKRFHALYQVTKNR
jgi:hypothetical protein